MQLPQSSSFDRLLNRSAAFSPFSTRKSPDFDIDENLGLIRRSASDANTISDKDSLYYQFRIDRVTKVRLRLENRLEEDPIAGFFRDRSLFARFVDVNGRKLSVDSDSARPEDTVALVSRRLSPGTYYLRLQSNFSGNIRYRLQLKTIAKGRS